MNLREDSSENNGERNLVKKWFMKKMEISVEIKNTWAQNFACYELDLLFVPIQHFVFLKT